MYDLTELLDMLGASALFFVAYDDGRRRTGADWPCGCRAAGPSMKALQVETWCAPHWGTRGRMHELSLNG